MPEISYDIRMENKLIDSVLSIDIACQHLDIRMMICVMFHNYNLIIN